MNDIVRSRRATRRVTAPHRQDSDFYPFNGGLNLIDSPLSSEPGQVQNALNYEIGFEGGYKRIGGYEKFDGSCSKADADYYLLPFSATTKPSALDYSNNNPYLYFSETRQVIEGVTGGARAILLDSQQDGGYGENVILSNTRFAEQWATVPDPIYWDIDPFTSGVGDTISEIVDGDYEWVDGLIPSLSRIHERTTSSIQHVIEAVGDPISCAEGDMLYISIFVKYKTGHPYVPSHQYARAGVRFSISNAVGSPFGGAASDPFIDVNIRSGSIFSASDHFLETGVDILSDDVLRIWGLTYQCSTADATMTLNLSIMDETSPTTMALTYVGNANNYIHAGGMCAVVLKPRERNPHNHVVGTGNFSDTNYWFTAALTIADNDTVWSSGLYPDFTRLTASGGTSSHHMSTLDAPNFLDFGQAHIRYLKGDKIKISLYVKWVTTEADGFQILLTNTQSVFDPDSTVVAMTSVNLVDGGITFTGSLDEHFTTTITDLGGDIYFCEFETEELILDGSTYLQFSLVEKVSTTVQTTTFDGSAADYLLITGMRFSCMPDNSEMTRMAVPITTTAAKNCKTGNLVVGGSSIGDFRDDEELRVQAINNGDSTAPDLFPKRYSFGRTLGKPVINSEINSTLDTSYLAQSAACALLVAEVPGSGPVLGVWMHRGIGYAFRDSLLGDRGGMWQATGAGWREVANLWELPFDAGTGAEPAVGLELSDATTGARGIVQYVDTISGAWGVDAAGIIYLEAHRDAFTNFSNNDVIDDHDTSTAIALVDGSMTQQTLTAKGRYEFRNHNFFGHDDKYRMYGVNGKDLGFEFDGINGVMRTIPTGMVDDSPRHLAAHNGHLFFAFKGGSVQLSGDGDPFSWTVITGAAEIGVGDEITGFNEEVGNSLFIFTRDSSFVLQGSSRANFSLDDFNINSGAHEWSVQRIGLGMFFDDRGFTSLLQTQRAGSVNFQENTQSALIQPLVEDLVRSTEVTCSHLIRSQNIYRCYFADGRIVSIGFSDHKVSGHMPLEYPFVANVACSQEDGFGAERVLIGAEDGNVYEVEKGPSFDGDDLRSFMRTVLYHSKSPGRMKKYTHARLDGTFRGSLTMSGRIEYDFDDPDWNLSDDLDFSSDAAGGYWDSFIWDEFIWDKARSGNPQVKIEGEGTNVSVYLQHTSAVDKAHTLRGMTLQWLARRADRRT